MAMTNSEEQNVHYKTVYEILPEFAEKLKQEGVISDWDRKQFKIELVKAWEPIRVNPDLVLHVPDRGKVVVEIVNPSKTKRFIGELVYPHILGNLRKIKAVVFLVLHSKGRRSTRAITQQISLDRFLKKTIPDNVSYLRVSDLEKIDRNRDQIYRVFRNIIIDYKRNGKFS
jgi:hypothetical protein